MNRRTLREWVLDFIAIVVFPGAAILLMWTAVAEQLSWSNLERTNATISENVVRRGSEALTCTIGYSFTDTSGREYRGRGRTHDPFCPNNPAGDFVVVEYVRTDPARSRILGQNYSDIYATF
jgi:uncharacterized protein DUF3592